MQARIMSPFRDLANTLQQTNRRWVERRPAFLPDFSRHPRLPPALSSQGISSPEEHDLYTADRFSAANFSEFVLRGCMTLRQLDINEQ
jgi:hypothetical protein